MTAAEGVQDGSSMLASLDLQLEQAMRRHELAVQKQQQATASAPGSAVEDQPSLPHPEQQQRQQPQQQQQDAAFPAGSVAAWQPKPLPDAAGVTVAAATAPPRSSATVIQPPPHPQPPQPLPPQPGHDSSTFTAPACSSQFAAAVPHARTDAAAPVSRVARTAPPAVDMLLAAHQQQQLQAGQAAAGARKPGRLLQALIEGPARSGSRAQDKYHASLQPFLRGGAADAVPGMQPGAWVGTCSSGGDSQLLPTSVPLRHSWQPGLCLQGDDDPLQLQPPHHQLQAASTYGLPKQGGVLPGSRAPRARAQSAGRAGEHVHEAWPAASTSLRGSLLQSAAGQKGSRERNKTSLQQHRPRSTGSGSYAAAHASRQLQQPCQGSPALQPCAEPSWPCADAQPYSPWHQQPACLASSGTRFPSPDNHNSKRRAAGFEGCGVATGTADIHHYHLVGSQPQHGLWHPAGHGGARRRQHHRAQHHAPAASLAARGWHADGNSSDDSGADADADAGPAGAGAGAAGAVDGSGLWDAEELSEDCQAADGPWVVGAGRDWHTASLPLQPHTAHSSRARQHGRSRDNAKLQAMQQQLAKLVEQLAVQQRACEDACAEKQALVVERSATIIHVQSVLATLLPGPGSPASRPGTHKSAADVAARVGIKNAAPDCAAAEQRLAVLCAALPASSSVRALLTASELLPCLKELLHAAEAARARWGAQAAAQQQELQETKAQLGSSQQEVARAAEQVSSLRAELDTSRQQLQQGTQLRDEQARRAQDEALQLRQRALAAEEQVSQLQAQLLQAQQAHEQQLQQVREEGRLAAAAAAAAAQAAEAQEEQRRKEVEAAHLLQLSAVRAELEASRAAAEGLQSQLAHAQQQQAQQQEQAQAAHLQAAQLNDKLAQQVAGLKEQKAQLQVVVSQAEQQLQLLREDLHRLREKQQHMPVCVAAHDGRDGHQPQVQVLHVQGPPDDPGHALYSSHAYSDHRATTATQYKQPRWGAPKACMLPGVAGCRATSPRGRLCSAGPSAHAAATHRAPSNPYLRLSPTKQPRGL